MYDSPIQQIKERLDIIEVISDYIKLQKAGANYKALCPFHNEKTPSFVVSPVRQIWHCFGACGEGGDIFKFVMKMEGVEFGDALRILAQKAGVELKRQDPALKTERRRLYEICELATKFFEKQLKESVKGKEARKYLLKRGIKEQSLVSWRIGYASDKWQALSDFLLSRGYNKKEIEKAGLALMSNKGSFYDRFRGRIIFPVFDFNSQVIGFGARIFQKIEQGETAEQVAKYLNTPNTLLYNKSWILYGLDKAKTEIRKKDFCILVEGYIDAIMSAQVGLENVVASSGTALTSYQLKILKRYSKNLLLAFDMDLAGDTATKRSIDLAQTEGFNLKVITMPQEKDPADIAAVSPKEWQNRVKKAKDITEFYFETTFDKYSGKPYFKPEEKVKISEILLPVIKKIPNKILQFDWIAKLSKRIKIKEEILEAEFKKSLSPETKTEKAEQDTISPKKSRREMLEEKILSLILKDVKNADILEENSFLFFTPKCQKILKQLRKKNFNREKFQASIFSRWDEETRDFLNYLALKADLEPGDQKEIKKEILSCLRDLKELVIKQKLEKVSESIKQAEQDKKFERVNALLEKFNQLTKQLEENY